MPTDAELLEKLLDSTHSGRLDWQKTAVELQYATSFGGKWTVQNADGDEMLQIASTNDYRVQELFYAARRRALKVDEALADVLKDLDKPPK